MLKIPAIDIKKLDPWVRLVRFDKPTGTLLLLFPCLFALGLAPVYEIPIKEIIIFCLGAYIMRSAGCIINDITDRKIDAQVKRTMNRPLANGELSITQACLALAGLLAFALLLLLFLNKLTIILGITIVFPILLYPWMKRITHWPQLFLGFTFNWGAIMAWTAVTGTIHFSALTLYAACILWTLGYDTIYALQDKEDDQKLGVKSTAITLKEKLKKHLYIYYGGVIVLLWLTGLWAEQSALYHLFLLAGAIQLLWQILHLQPENPENCVEVFKSNVWFGWLMVAGTIMG